MASNRKYHLERVVEMQDHVLEIQREHPGLPLTKIYSQYVRQKFKISYTTYRVWLGIPAKAQLARIVAAEAKKKELIKKKQTSK